MDKVLAIFSIEDRIDDIYDYLKYKGVSRFRHLLRRLLIDDIELRNKEISFTFVDSITVSQTMYKHRKIIQVPVLINNVSLIKLRKAITLVPLTIETGFLYPIDTAALTSGLDVFGQVTFILQ